MSTHTPFPWTVEDNGQSLIIWGQEESHPMGPRRAQVANLGFHRCAGGKQPSERQEADAGLILGLDTLLSERDKLLEQNRELVAALQAVLPFARLVYGSADESQAFDDAVAHARAAIAKATGQA